MLWRVVRCRWNISSELCCALLTGPTGEGGFFKAVMKDVGLRTEDWPPPTLVLAASTSVNSSSFLTVLTGAGSRSSPGHCDCYNLGRGIKMLLCFLYSRATCDASRATCLWSHPRTGGGRQEMFCVCSIQLLRHAAAVTTVTSPADMEAVLEDLQNREYNTAHKWKLYPVSSMLVWKDLQMKASFKNLS